MIISQGQALVTRHNAEIKEETELCYLKTGDYFGETALLANNKRGELIAPPTVRFVRAHRFRAGD